MHVAPIDLRAVRQDGITIRFAMLGAIAYILAEVPETGSLGTSLERPCRQAHWGVVIGGGLTFVTARDRLSIPAGHLFHVPAGGPEHHFEVPGSALIAGFQPVETEIDVSEENLVARGFEIMSESEAVPIVPLVTRQPVAPGQIQADSWPMAPYVMCRVQMGERSGYTSGWCDAPHWGIVTEGRLAIEWEDDVELLSKGDVFHCPGGPPGHRMEAADPATIIDLTPIAALEETARLADWRRSIVVGPAPRSRGIAVAALG